MNRLYPAATAAFDGLLRNGLLIAAGGFGLCGIPGRLMKPSNGGRVMRLEH
jgi:3-oxoacid CoA-transferase subunit A